MNVTCDKLTRKRLAQSEGELVRQSHITALFSVGRVSAGQTQLL